MARAPPSRTAVRQRSRLLSVGLVSSLVAVAETPDVAVRVGEGAAVPAPRQSTGGLEDRGAGLLGLRNDLVDPRLAADDVGQNQSAEAAAFLVRAHLGGQALAAVEAHGR